MEYLTVLLIFGSLILFGVSIYQIFSKKIIVPRAGWIALGCIVLMLFLTSIIPVDETTPQAEEDVSTQEAVTLESPTNETEAKVVSTEGYADLFGEAKNLIGKSKKDIVKIMGAKNASYKYHGLVGEAELEQYTFINQTLPVKMMEVLFENDSSKQVIISLVASTEAKRSLEECFKIVNIPFGLMDTKIQVDNEEDCRHFRLKNYLDYKEIDVCYEKNEQDKFTPSYISIK